MPYSFYIYFTPNNREPNTINSSTKIYILLYTIYTIMHFSRKIIILFIIILTSVVLWNLYLKRQELVRNMDVEGFTVYPKFTIFPLFPLFPTIDQQIGYELDSMTTNTSIDIQPIIKASYYEQPINQFCIKGSYNSAVTGTFVNADAVKYILSRGCRFIDLEIFSIDDKAQVAYTTDPEFNMIDTYNSALIGDIFSIIAIRGFNKAFSPNGGDPLFINLRIKSLDPDIYNKVAIAIHAAFIASGSNTIYDSAFTAKTTVNEIMGKIVFIMDATVNPNYREICANDTNKLTDHIHIDGGSSLLFVHQYNELLGQSGIEINPAVEVCSVCTDIKQLRLALPDTEYKQQPNMLVDDFVKKYACQFVPFKFYSPDSRLKDYETMFNFHKTAIVPMSRAITYIKNKYAPKI